MNFKKIILFVVLTFLSITIISCGEEEVVPTLSFDISQKEILVGEEFDLVPTITGLEGEDLCNFAVDQPEVVSITGQKVKALKAGTAIITASLKGYSDITFPITVTVKDLPVVAFSEGVREVYVGETVKVEAVLTNATGTITYKSNHETIATVDATGTVTGVAEGVATIVASYETYQDEIQITVSEKPSITISGPSTVYIGERIALNVELKNLDDEVTWTSSDRTIARVTYDGKVDGYTEGKVTITATCGEYTDTFEVEVLPVPSIVLSGDATVVIGETITLDVAKKGVTDPVTYQSSDATIATVSESGVVTGVKAGKVTITATCGALTSTHEVEVLLPSFTVTFKDNENNEIAKVTVVQGNAAIAPEAPEKEGWLFASWDVDFTNIQGDLTVTAVYTKTYKLTYHLNEGQFLDESLAIKTFVNGQTITLVNPVRDGYKFLGWTLTENGTEYVTEFTGGEQDGDVYAAWKVRNESNIYNVGPDKDYATIALALEDARDGALINVDAGTYSEDLVISLSGVTINGANSAIDPNSGTRVEETIITGVIEVTGNNTTISGISFTAATITPIKLTAVNGFVFTNNIVETTAQTAGVAASGFGQIQSSGNVANIVVANNKFTLNGTLGYNSCIYLVGKATNVKVDNNYFTNSATPSINVVAIWLPSVAGDIEINNNNFHRFAGNHWTVHLGQTAVADNTIIDFMDNIINGISSESFACGFSVDNLRSDTIYLNVIGNTFTYAKDTVLGLRGTATTDSTSTPHVTIMYNKFLNTSARMRFGMATTNFYFGNNYAYTAYTNSSTTQTISAPGVTQNDYASADLLDAAYATYKESYVSPYGLIEYETNGGLVVGSSRYLKGAETVLPTPTYEGYKFLGWTKEATSTEYVTSIASTETEDLIFYAQWEKIISFVVTYNFNGGVSDELYIAAGQTDLSLAINNYNYNGGAFWTNNAYASFIFIGDSSNDPKATFSDRIYIGKNEYSGLYEIVNILTSGGSVWPDGAEYVITISSSYSDYRSAHAVVQELSVGQIVAFSKDMTTSTDAAPTTAYFYSEAPTASTITINVTSADKLVSPSRLGYSFSGWYDGENNLYEKIEDLNGDTTLYARWVELTPVTDIVVSAICEEIETGSKYQIEAKVAPDDAFFQQLFFESSDTDVLVVDEKGLITAKNAGTATITITDYAKKVTKTFEVVVHSVSSIDVSPDKLTDNTLPVGNTMTLIPTAVGKDSEGVTFTYASSDAAILTVNDNGEVTAVAAGTAEIIITDSRGKVLRVGFTVLGESGTEDIDKVLDLIVENHFAVVETGNACLYNDGHDRYYDSMYGSVNKYLFAALVKDEAYVEQATNNSNGHQDRDPADTIEFVTVHDTATLTGTSASIANNMSSGETSIHYAVGNGLVYSVVPERFIAYHAGDGTRVDFTWLDTNVAATSNEKPKIGITNSNGKYYFVVNGTTTTLEAPITNGDRTIANPTDANLANLGPVWKVEDGKYYIGNTWACFSQVAAGVISSYGGNNNSIGIEMCVNMSGDIYDTWQRTAKLVADILIRNNLDTTRVQQHNTWTGKNCPQSLIAGGYWNSFMKMVELEYELQKNYADVQITMVSNDPSIVDNTGRVIAPPLVTTTVSYTVTVTASGQSKSVTLYSVIPGTTTWTQWDGTYSATQIWNNGNFAIKEK